MACKCIDEVPKRVIALMNEQPEHQEKTVTDACFKDMVFPIRDGKMFSVLKSNIALTVKGRQTPKKTYVAHSYCPFCGTEY